MDVTVHESFQEMMDVIDEARKEADKRVKPWQAAIKPGDQFVQNTPYDFLIFGVVLDGELDFYDTETGRNYRFCECFSVACPEGELGDVHVSQITRIISEETFLKYKEKDWYVEEGDTL